MAGSAEFTSVEHALGKLQEELKCSIWYVRTPKRSLRTSFVNVCVCVPLTNACARAACACSASP
jgi:hypothetical protein